MSSAARHSTQAVFETVLESAVKLCGALRAFIYRFDGELFGWLLPTTPQEFKEFVAKSDSPWPDTCAARAALERQTIHIPDA